MHGSETGVSKKNWVFWLWGDLFNTFSTDTWQDEPFSEGKRTSSTGASTALWQSFKLVWEGEWENTRLASDEQWDCVSKHEERSTTGIPQSASQVLATKYHMSKYFYTNKCSLRNNQWWPGRYCPVPETWYHWHQWNWWGQSCDIPVGWLQDLQEGKAGQKRQVGGTLCKSSIGMYGSVMAQLRASWWESSGKQTTWMSPWASTIDLCLCSVLFSPNFSFFDPYLSSLDPDLSPEAFLLI